MGGEYRVPIFTNFDRVVVCLRALLEGKPPATLVKAGGIFLQHRSLIQEAPWDEIRRARWVEILLDLATTVNVTEARNSPILPYRCTTYQRFVGLRRPVFR